MTEERLTDIIVVLLDALQECEEYFDDRMDVVDGPDSQPRPNPEMRMLEIVRAAMRRAGPQ